MKPYKLFFMAIALGVMATACASSTDDAATTTTDSDALSLAKTRGGRAIVTEVDREFKLLRETHYTHDTRVVESKGLFDVDCSGFANYVLGRAAPTQLAALEKATGSRPLAEDYVTFLSDAPASAGWDAVATVADLAPGDIVAWLEAPNSGDTGHVMIVRGAPKRRDAASFIVPVWDSVDAPHGASDSRASRNSTGLGRGDVVVLVDDTGAPIGHEWSDGSAHVLQRTTMGRVH